MKRLLALCLAGSLLATPALATNPSLVHLANNQNSATNTITISGITIAANEWLGVACGIRAGNSGDTVSISDSASDSGFITHTAAGFGTFKSYLAAVKTLGMSGGSVTVSFNTSSAGNVIACSVDHISNTNGEDTAIYAQTASSSTTTPSTTTGTPTQSGDLLYGAIQYGNATMTEDASWTNIIINQGNTNGKGAVSDFPNASSSPVTHAPSFSTAVSYVQNVMGFSPSGGAAAPSCKRSLLGVGC